MKIIIKLFSFLTVISANELGYKENYSDYKNLTKVDFKNSTIIRSEILRDGFCPDYAMPGTGLKIPGTKVQDIVNNNGQTVDYSKCIYVFIGKWYSYNDAESECAKMQGKCTKCQGTLVSIHAESQNQVIQQIMQSSTDPNAPYSPYWIGIRQHCRGCEFEWANYSPVDYVNWSPGEPNNAGNGEDCGAYTAWDGKWNDDTCTKGFQWVCEVYDETTHPVYSGDERWISQGGCKEGWSQYAKGCYLKVGTASTNDDGRALRKNFNDANTYCAALWNGAQLAILPNRFYNNFAISFTKAAGANVWLGMESTTQDKTFHWKDGSRLAYTNWESGQPSGSEDENLFIDEVAMHTRGHIDQSAYRPGQWYDTDPADIHAFMCSHQLDPSEQPKPTGTYCPEGWKKYGYGCYMLSTAKMDFDSANSACGTAWNGDSAWISTLATVVDEYENAFINSLMYDDKTNYNFGYWGPIEEGLVPGAWIGFSGVKGEQNMAYKWVDDAFSSAFTAWSYMEPDTAHYQPNERATVAINKVAQWGTDYLGNSKLPSICKARPPSAYIVPDNRGDLLPCAEQWGFFPVETFDTPGYYCVKGYKEKTTYYAAEDMCVTVHGGHMVSVHSESEWQAVQEIVGRAIGTRNWFWMGLQRNTYGGFSWNDGSAVDFTAWAPTFGPEDDPDDDCTDSGDAGHWGLEKCTKPTYYACKRPRDFAECINIPNEYKETCGYPGIVMDVCLKDYNCCWDGSAPQSKKCYSPGAKVPGASGGGGMTVAGSVFLSLFMWCIPLAAICYYFTQMA